MVFQSPAVLQTWVLCTDPPVNEAAKENCRKAGSTQMRQCSKSSCILLSKGIGVQLWGSSWMLCLLWNRAVLNTQNCPHGPGLKAFNKSVRASKLTELLFQTASHGYPLGTLGLQPFGKKTKLFLMKSDYNLIFYQHLAKATVLLKIAWTLHIFIGNGDYSSWFWHKEAFSVVWESGLKKLWGSWLIFFSFS